MSESVNYIGMKATFKGHKVPLHLTIRFLGDGSHTSLEACMTALQSYKNLQFSTFVVGTPTWVRRIEPPINTSINEIDPDAPVKIEEFRVALLSGTWLYYFLDKIQGDLNRVNIQDRSNFDYTPHVTLPKSINVLDIPDECVLGPLYVKWDGKAHPVVV